MNHIKPNWPAPSNIKAATTTRQSWGQANPHTENDSTSSLALTQLLALPNEPIWFKQTHSTIALTPTPENAKQPGDAAYTATPKQICAVLTADCLPILICNQQGTHVAAIHAGWRGLAGGIIENTLEKLEQTGADLLVWLGPAIGPTKFEVGQDVFDAFVNTNSNAASAFKPHKEGKWLANLYELAKIRLRAHNISAIYGGDFCTYTQEDLFYSYRRDQGKTGRMASLIWIDEN